MLTVIDEYSWLPFSFDFPNMTTTVVNKFLTQIFTVSVHDLTPDRNKYDWKETKIKEKDTLMETRITEVEEPESDIHSKPMSNPEIYWCPPILRINILL